MFHSRFVLALMSALAIVSCASDPKAPNDANFTRAIDASIEKFEKSGAKSLCMRNPATIPDDASLGADGAAARAILDRYAQAGLVTRHQVMKNRYFYEHYAGAEMVPVARYSLTPTGQKVVTTTTMFGTRSSRICYGTARVGKIVNFSEPADMNGYRASQIHWIPRVTSVDDWAKTAGGEALVGPEIASVEETEVEARAVLTSTGWEVGKTQ